VILDKDKKLQLVEIGDQKFVLRIPFNLLKFKLELVITGRNLAKATEVSED
jgi:hypothetical protein